MMEGLFYTTTLVAFETKHRISSVMKPFFEVEMHVWFHSALSYVESAAFGTEITT